MDTRIEVKDAMERAYIDASAFHYRADFVRVGLQAALDASGLRMIGEVTEEEVKRAHKAFRRSNGSSFDGIAAVLRDFAAHRVIRSDESEVARLGTVIDLQEEVFERIGVACLNAIGRPVVPQEVQPLVEDVIDALKEAREELELLRATHPLPKLSDECVRELFCGDEPAEEATPVQAQATTSPIGHASAVAAVADALPVDDALETELDRALKGLATKNAVARCAASSRGGVFGDGGVNAENLAELAKKFAPTGTRVTDVATLRVGDRVSFLAGDRDELFTGTVEEIRGECAAVRCDVKNPGGDHDVWWVRESDETEYYDWRDLRLLARADAQADAQVAEWKARAERAESEVLHLRQEILKDHANLVSASGLTHMGSTPGISTRISTRDCLDEFCRVRGQLADYAARAETAEKRVVELETERERWKAYVQTLHAIQGKYCRGGDYSQECHPVEARIESLQDEARRAGDRADAAEKRVGELEGALDQWKAQAESFVSQGYEVACERDALKAQLAEREADIAQAAKWNAVANLLGFEDGPEDVTVEQVEKAVTALCAKGANLERLKSQDETICRLAHQLTQVAYQRDTGRFAMDVAEGRADREAVTKMRVERDQAILARRSMDVTVEHLCARLAGAQSDAHLADRKAEPAVPSPAYATAEEVEALREAVSWLAGAVSALRCGEGHASAINLRGASKRLAESAAKARKGGA